MSNERTLNGGEIARLMEKYNNGDPLTDSELSLLHDAASFLLDLFVAQKFSPLISYYCHIKYSLESMIECRKERK